VRAVGILDDGELGSGDGTELGNNGTELGSGDALGNDESDGAKLGSEDRRKLGSDDGLVMARAVGGEVVG